MASKYPAPDKKVLAEVIKEKEQVKKYPAPDPAILEEVKREQAQTPFDKSVMAMAAQALNVGGYLPEAAGGLAKLAGGDYVSERDKVAARMQQLEQEYPEASMLGKGAQVGAIMMAPSPFGKVKAAQTAGDALLNAGKGLVSTVGLVAAENPGRIEGEVDPIQLEERAFRVEEAATDPIMGPMMALPAVAPLMGARSLSKIPVAEKEAFKATGPTAKQFAVSVRESPKSVKNVGRFALDEGLIKAGDSVDDIFFKSEEYLKNVGKQIGDVYNQGKTKIDSYLLSNAGKPEIQEYLANGFDLDTVPAEIIEKTSQMLKGAEKREEVLAGLMKYFDDVKKDYQLPSGAYSNPDLQDLHKLKKEIGATIKWATVDKSPTFSPDKERAFKVALDYVNKAIDNELNFYDKVFGSQKGKELRQLNEKFSKASVINSNSLGKFARSEAVSDSTLGALAGTLGGAATYAGTKDIGASVMGSILSGVAAPIVRSGVNSVTDKLPSIKAVGLDKAINQPLSMAKPLAAMQTVRREQEPTFEGFPVSMTEMADPMLVPQIEMAIRKDQQMSNIQKANRLNLLRKYGRVYLNNNM